MNETNQQPQPMMQQAPVQPQPMPQPQQQQATSGDNITFDYNQLYANNQTTTPVQTPSEPVAQPVNTEQAPIVIPGQAETIAAAEAEQNIVRNVIPTFDTNALEGTEPSSTDALINSMRSDSQKENEEFKKNAIFIGVFFGVLIVAVLFLFPILAGYK